MDTPLSQEEPQTANYEITNQPGFKQKIITDRNTTRDGDIYYTTYDIIEKDQKTNKNEVWQLNTSLYTKVGILEVEDQYGDIDGSLNIYDSYYNDTIYYARTSQLYVIECNPINKAVTNNIAISLRSTCGVQMSFTSNEYFPYETPLDCYMEYEYQVFTTIDDLAQQYVDASITPTTNPHTWYLNTYSNVESKQTYAPQYARAKFASWNPNNPSSITNYQPTLNVNLDINLSQGIANYIYILIGHKVNVYNPLTNAEYHQSTMWSNAIIYDQRGNVATNNQNGVRYYNYYYSWENKIIMTGTYLPNTAMEVIDLPGLMFTILGMPWTFLSTAFSLTLFPNTPYSINISSLLLTILGIIIFIFIIRLILKVFR